MLILYVQLYDRRVQVSVTNVKFSPVRSCQEGGDLFVVFGVVSYHLRPLLWTIFPILSPDHFTPASTAAGKVRGNFRKSSQIVKKRLDFLCCLHLEPYPP